MSNVTQEKLYFQPGMTVKLRQNLDYSPKMVVKKKETRLIKNDEDKGFLLGIICFWFTQQGIYQEEVFNTKDLILIQE